MARKDIKEYEDLICFLFFDHKLKQKEIANLLNIHKNTVSKYVKKHYY